MAVYLQRHIYWIYTLNSAVLLFTLYLSVFLLFVFLQIRVGHWLLAYITQCDVPPTVDLMGSEISLWNFMFAKKENRGMKTCVDKHNNVTDRVLCVSYLPIATELCIFICHDFTKSLGQSVTSVKKCDTDKLGWHVSWQRYSSSVLMIFAVYNKYHALFSYRK